MTQHFMKHLQPYTICERLKHAIHIVVNRPGILVLIIVTYVQHYENSMSFFVKPPLLCCFESSC